MNRSTKIPQTKIEAENFLLHVLDYLHTQPNADHGNTFEARMLVKHILINHFNK